MAEAVKSVPESNPSGHDRWLYYDFELTDIFPKIGADRGEMKDHCADLPRTPVVDRQNRQLFAKRREIWELLDELDALAPVTTTAMATLDLCAGPHVPSTGRIKAFKTLSVAGATGRERVNRGCSIRDAFESRLIWTPI